MRGFFQRLLCRDILKNNERLIEHIESLKIDLVQKNNLLKEMEVTIDIADRLQADNNKKCFIEKAEKEKWGVKNTEWVVCQVKEDLSIYVYSPYTVNAFNIVLSVFISYLEADKQFVIEDIQIAEGDCSKGYGSVAMKCLFNLADELKIEQIVGRQYFIGDENRIRQESFYEKYNFSLNDGAIKWERYKSVHPFR